MSRIGVRYYGIVFVNSVSSWSSGGLIIISTASWLTVLVYHEDPLLLLLLFCHLVHVIYLSTGVLILFLVIEVEVIIAR